MDIIQYPVILCILHQGRGFTPRRQVNEATEVPEAKSNEKSDLDIIRMIEAYGLSNTSPQTSLKRWCWYRYWL